VFAEKMPEKLQVMLRVAASFLAVIFLAAVLFFSYRQALTEYVGGDRSQTIGIPMIAYWAPFLTGIALAIVANIIMAVRLARRGLPAKS